MQRPPVVTHAACLSCSAWLLASRIAFLCSASAAFLALSASAWACFMARFSSSALSLEACKACSALPVDAFSRCDSALISPCSLSTCLEYLASTSAVRDFASSKSCTRVSAQEAW